MFVFLQRDVVQLAIGDEVTRNRFSKKNNRQRRADVRRKLADEMEMKAADLSFDFPFRYGPISVSKIPLQDFIRVTTCDVLVNIADFPSFLLMGVPFQ